MLKAISGNVDSEVMNKDLIPKVIRIFYPDLNEKEVEEVRQQVVLDSVFKNGNINISNEEQTLVSGRRIRKDGRTRCIFENGTESNMLYRSVAKILYLNGKVLTENIDREKEEFFEKFRGVNLDDEAVGYLYVLKSLSKKREICEIKNLYKIGYSTIDVEKRIRNAENEPTYLMAPVKIEEVWKCYNMNPQKFEQLIHKFFGNSCLELDVFDIKGKRCNPREWFIAPLSVIEQAIALIINGKIINYRFDVENSIIVRR